MLSIDGWPVDHMDTGDALTVTTVEAPLAFDPALHRTRTLEVLEQTYVTVRSVKISQGNSLEDDHAARVEVERAFALQRSHFEEYVHHLEGHFRHQMSIGSAELVEARREAEGLASDLRVASATLESRDNVARELNETIRRDSEIKARMDGEIRQLQEVVHGSKLENVALSEPARSLGPCGERPSELPFWEHPRSQPLGAPPLPTLGSTPPPNPGEHPCSQPWAAPPPRSQPWGAPPLPAPGSTLSLT